MTSKKLACCSDCLTKQHPAFCCHHMAKSSTSSKGPESTCPPFSVSVESEEESEPHQRGGRQSPEESILTSDSDSDQEGGVKLFDSFIAASPRHSSYRRLDTKQGSVKSKRPKEWIIKVQRRRPVSRSRKTQSALQMEPYDPFSSGIYGRSSGGYNNSYPPSEPQKAPGAQVLNPRNHDQQYLRRPTHTIPPRQSFIPPSPPPPRMREVPRGEAAMDQERLEARVQNLKMADKMSGIAKVNAVFDERLRNLESGIQVNLQQSRLNLEAEQERRANLEREREKLNELMKAQADINAKEKVDVDQELQQKEMECQQLKDECENMKMEIMAQDAEMKKQAQMLDKRQMEYNMAAKVERRKLAKAIREQVEADIRKRRSDEKRTKEEEGKHEAEKADRLKEELIQKITGEMREREEKRAREAEELRTKETEAASALLQEAERRAYEAETRRRVEEEIKSSLDAERREFGHQRLQFEIQRRIDEAIQANSGATMKERFQRQPNFVDGRQPYPFDRTFDVRSHSTYTNAHNQEPVFGNPFATQQPRANFHSGGRLPRDVPFEQSEDGEPLFYTQSPKQWPRPRPYAHARQSSRPANHGMQFSTSSFQEHNSNHSQYSSSGASVSMGFVPSPRSRWGGDISPKTGPSQTSSGSSLGHDNEATRSPTNGYIMHGASSSTRSSSDFVDAPDFSEPVDEHRRYLGEPSEASTNGSSLHDQSVPDYVAKIVRGTGAKSSDRRDAAKDVMKEYYTGEKECGDSSSMDPEWGSLGESRVPTEHLEGYFGLRTSHGRKARRPTTPPHPGPAVPTPPQTAPSEPAHGARPGKLHHYSSYSNLSDDRVNVMGYPPSFTARRPSSRPRAEEDKHDISSRGKPRFIGMVSVPMFSVPLSSVSEQTGTHNSTSHGSVGAGRDSREPRPTPELNLALMYEVKDFE